MARRIETLDVGRREVKGWESKEQLGGVSSSRGTSSDSTKKRQRESSQYVADQPTSGPSVSLGATRSSLGSQVTCFKCKQPGHVRSQCTRPPKACHRCNQLGHLERNCPQRAGRRG
jgi:hypothetical protein